MMKSPSVWMPRK